MLFLNLIQSAGDSFQYSPNMILTQAMVADPFFLPRVASAVPGAGLDRNGIALPGDDRGKRDWQEQV
jgi:hypothetical protein